MTISLNSPRSTDPVRTKLPRVSGGCSYQSMAYQLSYVDLKIFEPSSREDVCTDEIQILQGLGDYLFFGSFAVLAKPHHMRTQS